MRILVCSSEAPAPPVNGLRLQVGALVAELGRRHDVRVLAVRAPDQSEAAGDERTRFLGPPPRSFAGRFGSIARSLATGRPRSTEEPAGTLRSALRDELARFRPDVVHVTPGRMAALGSEASGTPAVLAALDAWHLNVEASAAAAPGMRRWLLRLSTSVNVATFHAYGGFSPAYEFGSRFLGGYARRLHGRIAVSAAARHFIDRYFPGDYKVIPNGVDEAAFSGQAAMPVDQSRIVFTGVMDYAPNVTAAEFLALRVMPLVRAADRRAHLAIVGRNPGTRVRALGRSAGVDVVGEVPDLRPWLNGSRAFACAMRSGSGIKNKLLEAMAAGLPSVVTPLALRGLRAGPDTHVLVGRDEREIAAHLVRLLSDDALARRIGAAGREYVRTNHSWSGVARAYERLYEEIREEAAR